MFMNEIAMMFDKMVLILKSITLAEQNGIFLILDQVWLEDIV